MSLSQGGGLYSGTCRGPDGCFFFRDNDVWHSHVLATKGRSLTYSTPFSAPPASMPVILRPPPAREAGLTTTTPPQVLSAYHAPIPPPFLPTEAQSPPCHPSGDTSLPASEQMPKGQRMALRTLLPPTFPTSLLLLQTNSHTPSNTHTSAPTVPVPESPVPSSCLRSNCSCVCHIKNQLKCHLLALSPQHSSHCISSRPHLVHIS